MSDIEDRLRNPMFVANDDGEVALPYSAIYDMLEAADVILALRRDVADCQDALAPFAEAAELIPDRYEGGGDWPIVNNTRVTKKIVMGDLLRAKVLANREVES